MRKPLRALVYVALFSFLFSLINAIVYFFRKSAPFTTSPVSGNLVLQWDVDFLSTAARSSNGDLNYSSHDSTPLFALNSSLSNFIQESNRRQFVHNEHLYGPLPSPIRPDLDTVPQAVFVIQVHSRLDNLRLLIASLERVKYIENSLLIFSSDLVSSDFISLINSIQFARTVQIYFPHSIQVFPSWFPGVDPFECSDTHGTTGDHIVCKKKSAGRDQYGHTRNGSLAQIKHHWLWKFQFIFQHLVAIKHFTGNVIFLEEDYFVVEDILVTRRLVEEVWDPTKPNGVIAFGARVQPSIYQGDRVSVDYFISSRHNQGMGISRAMWKAISDCLHVFCTYDDYNWDWSLQQLGRTCIKDSLKVMIFAWFSRVYHLGECDGVHHHKANCSAQQMYISLSQQLSGPLVQHLYPSSLQVTTRLSGKGLMFRPSGGWGDPRDRALCHSIAKGVWNASLKLWAPHMTKARSPVYG